MRAFIRHLITLGLFLSSFSALPALAQTYTLGGTVSGLTGTLELKAAVSAPLRMTMTNTLSITKNGSFVFPTAFNAGLNYTVTVMTQPTGEPCAITGGTGQLTSNVTSVKVTCGGPTHTLGGTASGLTGPLVLTNGTNTVTVPASGSFTFATPYPVGQAYAVTVEHPPVNESCTVTKGSGVLGSANVTSVAVACTKNVTYSIGGKVSGLSGTVVLLESWNQNTPTISGQPVSSYSAAGSATQSIAASGSFLFKTPVSAGFNYAITIQTQPLGYTCEVANGSGKSLKANVTNITVTCYLTEGLLSGLAAGNLLELSIPNQDELKGFPTVFKVSANGKFTIPLPDPQSDFALSVVTQPHNQACVVPNQFNNPGAIVAVTCSTGYTVGGELSGLNSGGSVRLALIPRAPGEIPVSYPSEFLTISKNGAFSFATHQIEGAELHVLVVSQPPGEFCAAGMPPSQPTTYAIDEGAYLGQAGAIVDIAVASIANIWVTCVPVYSISGTVTDSAGAPLVGVPILAGSSNGGNSETQMAVTNSSGNYVVPNYPNGSVDIGPSQPGVQFTPGFSTVQVNGANVTGLNFVGGVLYTVSGTVVNQCGILQNANILASGQQTGVAWVRAGVLTSLPNGGWMTSLRNGSYTFTASDGSLTASPSSIEVTVNGASVSGVNFTLNEPNAVCHSGSSGGGGSASGPGQGVNPGGGGVGGAGGTQTYACLFSSCVTPLPNTCISVFRNENLYGWISFTNNCSETVNLTSIVAGSVNDSGGLMTLAPGASDSTGLSPSEAPNGFIIGVCPEGYGPWNPATNGPWYGNAPFICVE